MIGQTTLQLEIREFQPADYERLVAIYNAIYPGYERSVNEWRYSDENLDRSKYLLKRYTCIDKETDTIVGFGECGHAPWMFHPRKFGINIWIDPNQQKKGIGGTTYEHLNKDLALLSAVTAWTWVREDMPEPLQFCAKRGFREKMRAWESRLNPAQFDPKPFQEYSEKAEKNGITVTPFVKEQEADPKSLEKLYELVQTVAADMPLPEAYTPVSFDQWLAFEVKSPSFLPEGYMIAKDGEKYVGLSTVWKSEKEPTGLYQGLTGVRREYRGRGIAVALKLRVIDYARKNGYDLVKTWNDSTNSPMLAVNIKLGFKRQVGWITLEKKLG